MTDWLSRRRPPAAAKSQEPRAGSGASVAAEEPKEKDPQAEAKAAARRERLRQQREESILAALNEMDRWIRDQIESGLASFSNRAPQQCRLVAQRLVDAKASALATQIDALPSAILALPEAERAQFAMETLGGMHLLADAYRKQAVLPEALRHDVRRLIGWTTERQELLNDATALRVRATWLVLATRVEIQPDKLRRIETWLMSTDLRFAVLIDFVPIVAGQSGSAFVPGEAFEAELVFYPSAAPLRALLAERGPAQPFVWPAALLTLNVALKAYDALAATHPWLSDRPIFVRDVRIACSEAADRLWLVAEDGAAPIRGNQNSEVLALTAVQIVGIMGLWDGRTFTAMAAQTSLGPWFRAP